MLKLQNVGIKLGSFKLEEISFTIPSGSYGILCGETGCGKTTILEMVCGLHSVQKGSIHLNDRDITHLRPAERGLGYLPQDIALFSTYTVEEQIAFGPKLSKRDSKWVREKVQFLANSFKIEHLLKRKPYGLSGGERQRIGLARAIANEPSLLCLDEPFSALDEETHEHVTDFMKKMVDEYKMTVLQITHDLNEAEKLATVQFKLNKGKIERVEVKA